MNSAGWIGGGFAPIAIAVASERYGMSAAISASSIVYLLAKPLSRHRIVISKVVVAVGVTLALTAVPIPRLARRQ